MTENEKRLFTQKELLCIRLERISSLANALFSMLERDSQAKMAYLSIVSIIQDESGDVE